MLFLSAATSSGAGARPMTDLAVAALVRKRAELAGEIEAGLAGACWRRTDPPCADRGDWRGLWRRPWWCLMRNSLDWSDLSNPHTLPCPELLHRRRAGVQNDAIVFHVDHSLRIGGDGFCECLNELRFPRPLVAVSCAELLVKAAPIDRRVLRQVVEAVGKPDVDIERSGAVLQLVDGRVA
jgi:hypothetical protein